MRLIFLALILISTQMLLGQVPSTPEEIEQQYNKNIRKSRIEGVYIPKNIEEAIQEIIELSPPEALSKFAAAEEDFVVRRLHFGLGKWIAAKWNFIEGSRYSHYLKMKGVTFPDDMVDLTLTALHRHLNHKPLKIEKEISEIKKKRLKEQQERMKKRQVISTEVNKVDTTKIR